MISRIVAACASGALPSSRRRSIPAFVPLTLALSLAGCSSVPMPAPGTLSTYGKLGPTEGQMEKSRIFVDRQAVLAANTVAISPTKLSPLARSHLHEPDSERLVANALDRALCIDLSDRFRVVPQGQPADITVQVTIADIVPTGKVAAGVSKVATLGSSAVLPVGVPRLPIGLGGLAVEAEALNSQRSQIAAIVWARGANSITNSPRVSEIGDAYGLASSFAGQFSQILQKGERSSGVNLSLPSAQKLKSFMGGAPRNDACDMFGRPPGVGGFVATAVGAPPSWSDNGGKAAE